MQTIHASVTNLTFIADMESALRLLQPILALLHSLEADSPLLSQCLPLWLSVFQLVKNWAADEYQQTATLEATLLKRFKKCYHPAMSAAFLCDPAFYIATAESDGYIANEQRIADMAAHLKIDVWADATKVSQCWYAMLQHKTVAKLKFVDCYIQGNAEDCWPGTYRQSHH